MADLTQEQRQALFKALQAAFPDMGMLDVLVREGYGANFADVVGAGAKHGVAVSHIITYALAQDRVLDLVLAARADNPGNARLRKVADMIGLALRTHGGAYEAVVVKQAGFQNPEPWRALMGQREPCIFRIEVDVPGAEPLGIGTGFLVGPDLALSCDHVFELNGIRAPGFDRARVQARFDYKADAQGQRLREGVRYPLSDGDAWLVDRSPMDQLDYTLFRLQGAPGDEQTGTTQSPRRGWLAPKAYAFDDNETVVILQHPAGRPLSLSMGPVLRGTPERLWHKANTEPGSSGAPCFNAHWDLVALHHHGSDAAGENRAVPMTAVLPALQAGPGGALLMAPGP